MNRHGCLTLSIVVFLGCLNPASGNPQIQVQSRVFEIDYAVNEDAEPLEFVQLWYTLDKGRTWNQYGYDEDRQSPISFHAPSEGLFGFFVRASNTTGPSSDPPAPATEPHLWSFVDYTPPVVQLHGLRQTTSLGQRVVQIRWTAIDTFLAGRPVEIEFRKLPDGSWHPITPDPLANTGQYDWRVPQGLHGPVALRLHISDRGGHCVASEEQVAEISPVPSTPAKLPWELDDAALPNVAALTGNTGSPSSAQAIARAQRLYKEGLAFGEMGDHRQGISRLREAVKLNPSMSEAFTAMGDMLYVLGDFDEAQAAYTITLRQRPMMRVALRGMAKVHRQKHDYTSAAERLRTILRYNPDDAETWMNLGDIGIFQGDEVMARECYIRASQINPGAGDIIEQAKRRLSLMAEVSRTYRKMER